MLLLLIWVGAGVAAAQSAPAWQFIGPQPLQNSADGSVAGRIAALAADPGNPGSIFAAGMGGVWKTADNGLSWQPLTATVSASGALAFDPRQSGVVYAGTGDPNGAEGSNAGAGLLRSSDGGQTWSVIGAAVFAGMAISRIAVDPANSAHLLVATVIAHDSPAGVRPGLYSSTDGGVSWTNTIPGEAWDFAWDTAAGTVIATVGTSVYRSTNGGASFSVLSAPAIPTAISRAAICVLPGISGFLMVTADAQFDLGAVLQTSDDGQTWTSITGPADLFGPAGSGRGAYDITIAADPTTPNHWWLGGVDVWETKDGGSTWNDLSGAASVHTGQHALLDAGGELWIGNDGGVWYFDLTGSTPLPYNRNAGLGNFGVLSLAASPTSPDLWATVLQNGLDHLDSTASLGQIEVGGNGGTLGMSSGSSQPVYFIAPYLAAIETSTDGGLTFSNPLPPTTPTTSTPLADSAQAPWLVPVAVDPKQGNTVYCGSWRIWKSSDGGVSWTELAGSETAETIAAITVSPVDSNAVYAGTSGGAILASGDGGASWSTMAGTGLPSRPLNDLRAGYDSAQHLWAAFGGTSADGSSAGVFVSTDGGATWSNRSTGLPNAPVLRLLPDPLDSSIAYAALPAGVYATGDGGLTWKPLGSGLPAIPVMDLQIDAGRNLLAATFGRGVWSLPLGSVNQTVTAVSGAGQSGAVRTQLPQPLTVQVTSTADTPVAGVTVQWSDGGAGGVFSASSSTTDGQGNASVLYTLPEKSETVTVNASVGASIASFPETANPGPPAALKSIGGGQQSATTGTLLADPLIVQAIDAWGNGVPNVPVTFSDNGAGGVFTADPVPTGADGVASVGYTLPSTVGPVTVTASISGLTPVTFSENATAPPDFQLQASAGSFEVSQNASLTVTLQTTAVGGDTAPISLLCLRPVTGCAFSPNPVSPGAAAQLTLQSGSLSAGVTSTITVQGTDGTHTHQTTFSVTVVVPPGLGLARDPGEVSLVAGGNAAFTLTLTPQGGLSGPVKLSVADVHGAPLPTGMTGAFAPSTLTITDASAADTLTIRTTSRTLLTALPARAPWPPRRTWGLILLPGLFFSMLLAIAGTRRRIAGAALAVLLLTAAGCGGGSASAYQAPRSTVNPSGTPAGTYPLVVTAVAGNVSASVQITVTVQ